MIRKGAAERPIFNNVGGEAVAFSADRLRANHTVETPDKENKKYFFEVGIHFFE